ncbi:MAG: hypothetical protein ACYDCQ_05715 [Dehalococcoidia bacterium]
MQLAPVLARLWRHGGAVLVIGGLVAGTATNVIARPANAPAIIYSCVNDSSGTIKIVSATDTCHNHETALSWNQQGIQGPVGPRGPQGEKGAAGATGAAGAPGATGPAGAVGPTGAMGDTGATGATGAPGAVGPAGAAGPQGATGDIGPQGMKGDTGAQGVQGAQGPAGVLGYAALSQTVFGDGVSFFLSVTQLCPTGKKPLGGGFTTGNSSTLRVTDSSPSFFNGGWLATVESSTPISSGDFLTVYAFCATVQ